MHGGDQKSLVKVVKVLEAAASRIRAIEAKAREALFEKDDKASYLELLGNKMMVVIGLPDEVEHLLVNVDPDRVRAIRKALTGMARRAGQALELESPFYMSLLLYPDDYRDGDPNELELFARKLAEKGFMEDGSK